MHGQDANGAPAGWSPAPLPPDEEARLLDLQATEVLDTAPEQAFDALTTLASELLGVPMALISLVDRNRQWFKSRFGLNDTETTRDISFCGHAILGAQLFKVPNALQDPRFAGNPFVQGNPEIRFYAGVPLRSGNGHAFGTFCVLDRQSRVLSVAEEHILQRLALVAESLLEERRQRNVMQMTLDQSDRAVFLVNSMVVHPLNQIARQVIDRANTHPLPENVGHENLEDVIRWIIRGVSPGSLTRLRVIKDEMVQVEVPELTGWARRVSILRKPYDDQTLVVHLKPCVDVEPVVEVQERVLHVESVGYWNFDAGQGLIDLDPAWVAAQSLAPFSAKRVPVSEWFERIHPEDQSQFERIRADVAAGRIQHYQVMYRMQRQSGQWFWLHSRGEVVERSPQGDVIYTRGIHIDLTPLRERELSARKEQQLLSAILRSPLQVSIITTDLDGTITLFSSGAEQMLGYLAKDVVGQHSPQLFHDVAEISKMGQLLTQQYQRPVEGFDVFVELAKRLEPGGLWTYKTRTGQRLTVRLTLAPLQSEEGIYGYVGVAIDVTEQIQAERLARLAEQRMLQSFQSAAVGIGMVGLDGRWLEVNEALCTMLGYQREQLLERDVLSVTFHEDRELNENSLIQELEVGKQSYQLHKRYLRADGSVMRGLLSVAVLYDEQQTPSGYVALIQDVSEQYESEMELRVREEFQRMLIEQVANAIVSCDEEGVILGFNRAAEAMFGYAEAEVIGQNVSLLMPSPYRSQHDAYMLHYRESREHKVFGHRRELSGIRKSGDEFPLEIVISPIQVRGFRSFIAVIRDLTEQKQIESMTNQFISTVSHELRTPLTSIQGSIGLLLGGVMGDFSAEQKDLLNMAWQNGERLKALINDLLDMEKLLAGRMALDIHWWNLDELMQEVIRSMEGYARQHNVRMQVHPCTEPMQIQVDRLRWVQVMANLLSNAIKFSPVQGLVEVQVNHEVHMARILVLDRGPGVPEHFKARLFEKFAQADSGDTRSQGGTGLGLAISQELMIRMSGDIGYRDRPDGGGCFWIKVLMRRIHAKGTEKQDVSPAPEQNNPNQEAH